MKKYLFILILWLSGNYSSTLLAATFSSVMDGSWSTNATWGGSSSPSVSTADNITINDSVYTTSNIIIKNGGYLTIKAGAVLTVKDIEFSNGSHILIENGGKLIVKGNLTNKNNSNDVVINGFIDIDGNFSNGNGGSLTGTGSIHADGSYSGSGSTFGQTTSNISSNTTVTGGNLPIELLSFNYFIDHSFVTLKWATSSETNNDYFTIERSVDGISFDIIGTISGSGNSNEILYYQFTDEYPYHGTCYYRLKQTDFDGIFKYVSTIACDFSEKKALSFQFENPVVSDQLILFAKGLFQGSYSFDIINYSGQSIYSSTRDLGNSVDQISIPCIGLVKGYYIISIIAPDGKTFNYPFIKR